MKKLLLGFLFGVVLCAASLSAQPVKRVIIEEFTGAWCPWCTDGPVRLDAIHDKVGDLMIPVAIHDNDSMTTPEYNQSWKPMAPFFPSGMINRMFYSDESSKKVGIDRANWEKRTMEELAKPAVCDVTISKPKFSAATRELAVTVDASFVSDVAGDVRLNAYIVEDKVVGKGTGWDQANAYNKLAGNENHPMYGKGSPIIGFEHNHVFRRAMGGAWGKEGSVAANVKAGATATYTFTTTVPANWNPDNFVIVGIVQVYNTDVNKCEILNAVSAQSSPAPTVVASMANMVVAGSNESANNTGAIINQTDGPLTYVITAEKTARTPSDWTAMSSVGNEITVASKERVNISATLKVGATPGVGDAFLKVAVKDDPTQVYATQKTTAIHKDCGSLEILTESDQYSVAKSITASGRQGFWPVAASPKVLKELLKLTSLKTAVLNTGDAGDLSAEAIGTVQMLIDGGASMLITGNKAVAPLVNNVLFSSEAGINQALETGYGINSTGAFINFAIDGADENPTTAGMKLTAKLVGSRISTMDFAIPPNARPFLLLGGTPRAVAADMQFSNARCILMPTATIFGTKTDELVAKGLTWLEANTSTNKPIIRSTDNANPRAIDFGTVEHKQSKTVVFKLRNSGRAPMTISKLEWLGGPDDASALSTPNMTLPLTVKAGEVVDMQVAFAPPSGDYTANTVLTVHSDAANNPELSIEVVGLATASTSVPSEEQNSFARLDPNPASDMVHVAVREALTQPASVVVTDALGNRVMSMQTGLDGRLSVSTAQLASGVYAFSISTGNKTMHYNVVVAH